jgi:hypothetical protein
MVESAADLERMDRSAILEHWVEDRLEAMYPGCTGRGEGAG